MFLFVLFGFICLGPQGEPLRDVTRNLPSLQAGPSGSSAPAPVAPPIANAASLLGQPNLASNLAALSTLSNLTGVGALGNLGLNSDLNSNSNPAFTTSAGFGSGGGGRSSNDFDLGVRSYNTANDDYGRGGFNGRSDRQSDTIIIRNVSTIFNKPNNKKVITLLIFHILNSSLLLGLGKISVTNSVM